MKDYKALQQRYMTNCYINRGLTFLYGKGMYLYDDKKNKYLDLMTNYGVNIFGHNYPKITKVLSKQLGEITTLHGSFNNDKRALASEMVIKKCGEDYYQVYWSSSGAEAIEAALKFAVLATGKKRFIACSNGYHGKSLGALSASAGKKYREPFLPLLWDYVHIKYNNPEELENIINKDTAAFIVEPVQGEGGILVPDKDYLKKVKEICKKKNILLILDEIQTGTGRTGTFLASQDSNISGDILCLGKGLAGGIPVGATLVNKNVAFKIPRSMHTSTFGGNPLACAGVIAVLRLLDSNRLNHIKETGKYFINSLKKVVSENIIEVRGKGLMIGIEIKGNRDDVLKKLQAQKILAIPAGEKVVRFLPPYIITQKIIDTVVEKFKKAL